MRLLPKKVDIDRLKNEERRKEIESGVQLATRIDKLRETSLNEEKRLKEWREESIKVVKAEIAQFIEERDNLERQNNEARKLRDDLLKPLDNEWVEINKVKEELKQEKIDLLADREKFSTEEKKLLKKQNDLSTLITKAKQNEKDTEETKSDIRSLKELAQKEYEVARVASESQTNDYERKMSEASQRCKEYEVALSLVEIREREVKEKEVELLSDRKHLEAQQERLRKVIEMQK